MPFYGYARASTLDQDLAIQRAALMAPGCAVVVGPLLQLGREVGAFAGQTGDAIGVAARKSVLFTLDGNGR